MAPERDDAVLPEGDLSSSSQDDEEEDDVVDEDDDDDVDVDVDDEDDVLNDDVINSGSPSLPVAIAAPTVTVALPAPITTSVTAATAIVTPDPDPKRPRTVHYDPVILPQTTTEEKKPVAALDDSRRLFQRLWTDEDEIELLQGFLDYTTQRGGKGASSSSSHQNDTALFYDQIKSKLQLEFNKNQLVEKLRRLKKKYRNVLNKIASGKEVSFKSPHDQATFEISRKIWNNIGGGAAAVDDDDAGISHHNTPNFNGLDIIKTEEPSKSTPRSRKRSRPQQAAPPRVDEKRGGGYAETVTVVRDNNNHNNNTHNSYNGGGGGGGGNNFGLGNCNVQGMIEETVKSCLSPLFKELMSNGVMGGGGASRGFGGLSLNPIPLSFGGPSMNLNLGGGEAADERWRKQQILELEVYSKRLELVQSQIQVALDELRSTGGG